MKVILFHIAPIEWPGGSEKYFASLAKGLSAGGNRVVVAGSSHLYYLFMCAFYSLFDAVTGKGLHIVLPEPHPPRDTGGAAMTRIGLLELLPLTRARQRFLRLLRQADVIYCKNEWADLIVLRFFLPRRLMSKVVIGMHSAVFVDEDVASTPWGKVHELLYGGHFYRRQLQGCGAIHVLNAAYARSLATRFAVPVGKIVHIPNWLDPDELDRLAPRTDDIVSNSCLRVLFAQRMTHQKGVDYLAALVTAVSATPQFERLRVTIAGGSGDYGGVAIELAERFANVTYRGHVFDMAALYAEHDVAIVPSRWEMFPYSVLEPQAAGLPVIAFDIPGPQDIVVDSVTGWLAPLGDIAALKDIVLRLIDQQLARADSLRVMRRRSRELTLARFNRDTVLEKVTALLSRVADRTCKGLPA